MMTDFGLMSMEADNVNHTKLPHQWNGPLVDICPEFRLRYRAQVLMPCGHRIGVVFGCAGDKEVIES